MSATHDVYRHDDGVLYEHGPRTVRPAGEPGANTLALVEDLGLTDR
jgi:oxygen-dependent protoporphyrinogen oxidase